MTNQNLLHMRLNHFLTIRLTRLPCRVNLRPIEILIGVNFSRPLWAAFSLPDSTIASGEASDNEASTLQAAFCIRAALRTGPVSSGTHPARCASRAVFFLGVKRKNALADKGALKVPAP